MSTKAGFLNAGSQLSVAFAQVAPRVDVYDQLEKHDHHDSKLAQGMAALSDGEVRTVSTNRNFGSFG